MAKPKTLKQTELKAFWRAHHDAWMRSTLNQREYCEAHGLPLKRFGNWRARFKTEKTRVSGRVLYRRGGQLSHMTGHMTDKDIPPPSKYLPSRSDAPNGRRQFSPEDKRRIVAETEKPGATVSGVARRYNIAQRVLFRWKNELSPPEDSPTFLCVEVEDGASGEVASAVAPSPIIIERGAPGIEVELVGGRRIRFDKDVDPDRVRQLVSLLEADLS
ncbi:IS66-like element accessory protein TnpA [Henriciella marina]|uniref:IS66-like element accessory protein TnpA n=1 Tax=Henriciella marina TaxID=453851 RepID=UPI0003751AA9|nr:transposase [Henriciella marina]